MFDLISCFTISDWLFLAFLCFGIYWLTSRIYYCIEWIYKLINDKEDHEE